MPRGRKVTARNIIGSVLVIRRRELNLARHYFRWRYRLEQIEGTAKVERALRLLRMEGSEQILDVLGFTIEDLSDVLNGELGPDEALERARERRPDATGSAEPKAPSADSEEPAD